MSRDLDAQAPWMPGEIQPGHVIAASVGRDRPVEEVLAVYDELAPLGVRVAGRERFPADLEPLEVEALRETTVVGQPMSPMRLASIAARTGVSPREVHEALARLESRGLLARPDTTEPLDFSLEPEDSSALRSLRTMWGERLPDLPQQVAAREIACAIGRGTTRANSRYRARMRALAAFARPVSPFTKTDLLDPRGQVTQLLEPASLWAELRWRVGPGEIVAGAFESGLSIGAYLELLAPYRQMGVPVPEPGEGELHDIRPDEEDAMLLVRQGDKFISAVGAVDLVRAAGRFGWTVAGTHRRLLPLVPLGLTLDHPHDACPDTIVRWQDLLALTVDLDGHAPAVAGAVTAEHLAHAAEQLDEPPERVGDRLRPYARLFTLTPPARPATARPPPRGPTASSAPRGCSAAARRESHPGPPAPGPSTASAATRIRTGPGRPGTSAAARSGPWICPREQGGRVAVGAEGAAAPVRATGDRPQAGGELADGADRCHDVAGRRPGRQGPRERQRAGAAVPVAGANAARGGAGRAGVGDAHGGGRRLRAPVQPDAPHRRGPARLDERRGRADPERGQPGTRAAPLRRGGGGRRGHGLVAGAGRLPGAGAWWSWSRPPDGCAGRSSTPAAAASS